MEWLILLSEYAIVAIDAIALAFIVLGTVQAVIAVVRAAIAGRLQERRDGIWLQYARWLVGGLTFQLAADIIETSITTDWQTIGRVGAIAVVRTFLNYFLGRDLAEARESERESPEGKRAAS
ncbi:MAG TPA: DUF1622 domain-containing protein [Burkholderiaceae bacterium]